MLDVPNPPPPDVLLTLTHARVRAAQGDLEGARRIARAMLARDPGDRAARDFLDTLAGRPGSVRLEPEEDALAPPVAGDPSHLSEHFRQFLGPPQPTSVRARLETWLDRIRRNAARNPL